MPLRLTRRHNSPNWYIRGTVRGIAIDESTRTDRREAAEALRIRREAELLDRSIHGRRATATFLEAAVSYMEAGGETRYLGPLIDHFGALRLAALDQMAIDVAAQALYPAAAPATRNRQVYTPISAVLRHAAERGLCEHRAIRRPRTGKERVRWLTPAEAERLIECCAPHMTAIVTFLFYTGARVSEALRLDWRCVDLNRAHVAFLDTKNGTARGMPLHPRLVALLANLQHRDRYGIPPPRRPPLRAPKGPRGRPDQNRLQGRLPAGRNRGLPPARLPPHLGDLALWRQSRLDGADAPRRLEIRAHGAALRSCERWRTGRFDRRFAVA